MNSIQTKPIHRNEFVVFTKRKKSAVETWHIYCPNQTLNNRPLFFGLKRSTCNYVFSNVLAMSRRFCVSLRTHLVVRKMNNIISGISIIINKMVWNMPELWNGLEKSNCHD